MFNIFQRFKTLINSGAPRRDKQVGIVCDDDEFFYDSNSIRHRSWRTIGQSDKPPLKIDAGTMVHCEDISNMKGKSSVAKFDAMDTEPEFEDAQSKVLRLFRFKILHYACNMDKTPESTLDKTHRRYVPSPDYEVVRTCRLVCKDWNYEISQIFDAVEKPIMVINPSTYLQKQKIKPDAQSVLEVVRKALVRPNNLQSRNSDLPVPTYKLHLPSIFFYKDVENQFINVWKNIEQFLYEFQFDFPVDSSMRFYWPSMNLENLKKIKFKCTYDSQPPARVLYLMPQNPFRHGNYMYLVQGILNGAVNAEYFKLHCLLPQYAPELYKIQFPPKIKSLDIPMIKMEEDVVEDHLLYHDQEERKCLKKLTIRAPVPSFKPDTTLTGCFCTYMLEKYGKSLETVEITVAGQDIDHIVWTMRRDYIYQPMKFKFESSMPNLTSLTIHAGNWELTEFPNYHVYLPSLRNLQLTMITNVAQVRALYQHRCDTVKNLNLSFVMDLAQEVTYGFAKMFPEIQELTVVTREHDTGLRDCFQEFKKLKRLYLSFTGISDSDGKELLFSAISGIPNEVIGLIMKDQMTISEVMEQYQYSPSLRHLTDLEDMTLIVHSSLLTDISILLRTTFLRMPKLKKLKLSQRSLTIVEDEKDAIRKENQYGVDIIWI